ncbi:MAG: cobalt-precorrin 5A hydrolase [Fretibacterium sp.]|nr:cobalt-precorrin 5A hydrolase [Fretibacterium sp.]
MVLAAFTAAGVRLGLGLAEALGGRLFAPPRFCQHCQPGVLELKSLSGWADEWFPRASVLIFVSACGIAVRAIAPLITRKDRDPAVLVLDEHGRHVISLLSGHLGGANELARRVAALTGGTPVITTATDVNEVTAVDEWAAANDCAIENLEAVRHISGRVLDGGPVGVAVTEQLQPAPWPVTLWLRPRNLALGVGCKRGVPSDVLLDAAQDFLQGAGVSSLSLFTVASLDLKKDEPGLIALAGSFGVPFVTFGPEELRALPGRFSASGRVEAVTGVDNVCERSAVRAAGPDAVLLRSKTIYPGVTLALARRPAPAGLGQGAER